MIKTLKKFFLVLSARERRRFWQLQVLVMIQGLAEVAATLSVLPFLRMATDPTAIEASPSLQRIMQFAGVESDRVFTMLAGGAVLILLVCANMLAINVTRSRTRYIFGLLSSVSSRLLRGYLNRDYAFYLRMNTTTLAKNVLAESNELISDFVNPVMMALARIVPTVMIVISIAIIDWRVVFLVGIILAVIYWLVDVTIRRRQRTLGAQRLKANQERYRVLGDAFGSIKEIKLHGLEDYHAGRFEPAAKLFADAKASNQIAAQAPKYVIEPMLFGGLIAFCVFQVSIGNNLAQIAPQLAFFALALYRVLPSMQDVFKNAAAVRFNSAALDNLVSQVKDNEADQLAKHPVQKSQPPILLRRELVLDGITFRYDEARPFSLADINLRIPALCTVGLVGRSGAGKSTLADIVLGLLQAQQGAVVVDGRVIDGSCRRAWQRSMGYVPQTINLIDASICENIALGVDPAAIDRERIMEVARIADLHDFITDHLPEGYDTHIGEKGVRMSGGQRQRIGIARALYRNPTLLVFDEATSALDSQTEEAVLGAIQRLTGKLTMIIIAHRRSTLAFCDQIFRVEAGRVLLESASKESTGQSEPVPSGAEGLSVSKTPVAVASTGEGNGM